MCARSKIKISLTSLPCEEEGDHDDEQDADDPRHDSDQPQIYDVINNYSDAMNLNKHAKAEKVLPPTNWK